MQILCVIDNLGAGGAQRQITELAMGFKEMGHEVSFLNYDYKPFFTPILHEKGIRVTCINEPGYLKRLLKIRKFIRRGNFDAILSFLEGPNFICEFSGFPVRKWKLIVGERDANPQIIRSLKQIAFRWGHLFADYVVSNSSANIRLVQKINPFLSKARCKVIYNIVDFNKWRPAKQNSKNKNGRVKLIVAASHQYKKNLNGLIEAVSLLPAMEREKLHINWYGHRLYEPFIDQSIAEARRKIKEWRLGKTISFIDTTSSLEIKMRRADAVGLFSFYEGLPNVVCEGMACAKPVVFSEVSDLPELLSHSKFLMCDPYSPKSIQQALSKLINLSREDCAYIGKLNQRVAKQKFVREDIVSKYLQLMTNEKVNF